MYKLFLLASALIITPLGLNGNPITTKYSDIIDINPQINIVCSEYLQSKGFNDIQLKTLRTGSYEWENTYAFTMPTTELLGRTIFMSPRMLESLEQQAIDKNLISVYDKFVLLHEMGHLYPYGLEYALLNSKIDRLMNAGITGIILIICEKLLSITRLEKFNYTLPAPKNDILEAFRRTEYLGLFYLPPAKTIAHPNTSNHENIIFKSILTASVLALSAATYLTVAKRLPILRKFKKLTFRHEDKKIETHVKKACDEQDADSFSLQLLSRSELETLYEYFAIEKDIPIIIDESAYHPSSHDRWIAIGAEIDSRG